MKSIVAIILSVIALGISIFGMFSEKNTPIVGENTLGNQKQLLAFIYSDSVNDKYQFVLDKTDELEQEAELVQAEIERKIKKLENRFSALQKKAATMTQSEMESAQMELAQMEQEVNEYRANAATNLDKKRGEMQREFFSRVNDFLEAYNRKANFEAIFSYTEGGQLLYVNEALDITEEVIVGLNEEYQTSK